MSALSRKRGQSTDKGKLPKERTFESIGTEGEDLHPVMQPVNINSTKHQAVKDYGNSTFS